MEANLLLESYLKQLHLPGFLRSYRSFAADAARNNEDPVRYLLALAEQEVHQREQNMQRERVKQAHFPVLRELADFDFSAVPSLNKAYVLDLARGDYIARHEPVIFIGNPGLGKTHLALGLALAACRQRRKVRFWTAAGLVNELQQAQDEHRLSRFSTAALKLDLLVLDELGLHPVLARRGAVAVYLLFRVARAGGRDCDLKPQIRGLDSDLRAGATHRGPARPPDPKGAHPGTHRRVVPFSPAPAKGCAPTSQPGGLMDKWTTAKVTPVAHLPTAPTTTATASAPFCYPSASSGTQSDRSTTGTMSPSMMKWARFR